MNVLIFEDEKHTATRLIQLLKKYDPELNVLEVISSVKKGIEWFKRNPVPDLIFQDILLNDGNCFEMYEKVKVKAPVIFTTAFNEFALRSFELNSIDYLVKPYDYNDIKTALDKFLSFKEMFVQPESDLLRKILQKETPDIKKRFLIKLGDKYQSVKSEDIAWFISDEGITFAYSFENTRFPVDLSIDLLSGVLDPEKFFRINRKFLINFDSIKKIHAYFNNRLKLEIVPPAGNDIIVSRERIKEFKEWLGR
ncbi:MAG: response regulator transcription factor [Prolixibacteraceae bacterium]|nr:response regulator transcription factor [Prolixibacteraceae bacterium]MBN2774292.1 response regulator transcription factor [Prolixibacteraceae bacterium]